MRMTTTALVFGAAMALAPTAQVLAADDKPVDIGKQEFEEKCAVCHGRSGKGDGGVAELLKKAPADLTVLTKNNGGVFPFGEVYGVIDGRQVVKGHGDRDMPVWGRDYLKEHVRAQEYFLDTKVDMELYVRLRILALIDYLNRLQEK